MRPDEFGKQMAGKWTRAEKVQVAWHKGRKKVDDAVRRAEEIKRKDDEARKAMIAKHSG